MTQLMWTAQRRRCDDGIGGERGISSHSWFYVFVYVAGSACYCYVILLTQRQGIIVTNTPGVLSDATADLALALILNSTRRLFEAEKFLRCDGRLEGGGSSAEARDLNQILRESGSVQQKRVETAEKYQRCARRNAEYNRTLAGQVGGQAREIRYCSMALVFRDVYSALSEWVRSDVKWRSELAPSR